MAEDKAVFRFAIKWRDRFRNPGTRPGVLTGGRFGRECAALGFRAEDGKISENDTADRILLGNAIYGRWRELRHRGRAVLEQENRAWFSLALDRLATLSREKSQEERAGDTLTRIRIEYRRAGHGVYEEYLLLDRETGTLEQVRDLGNGCRITRRYEIAQGVENLLSYAEARHFFESIPGTTGGPRDYTITLDYQAGPRRVLTGSAEKRGLPEELVEFARIIRDFLSAYGDGEILNSTGCRTQADKLMYCGVQFSEGGKRYSYLSRDPSIGVGDWVIVPAGRENREKMVKVVEIGYYSREEAPLPPEKTKHILQKCTEDTR